MFVQACLDQNFTHKGKGVKTDACMHDLTNIAEWVKENDLILNLKKVKWKRCFEQLSV
jgi:hypothetical protein